MDDYWGLVVVAFAIGLLLGLIIHRLSAFEESTSHMVKGRGDAH